jgi:hypothetical protein
VFDTGGNRDYWTEWLKQTACGLREETMQTAGLREETRQTGSGLREETKQSGADLGDATCS